MALAARHWQADARLIAGSENRPAVRAGEPNRAAVTRLQRVLMATGFSIPDGATGNFMQQTSAAVREAEAEFSLTRDQGVAGREVFGALDRFLVTPGAFVAGGASGAALATSDAPAALRKVGAAITAIVQLLNSLINPTLAPPRPNAAVVNDALRLHFRLTPGPATIGAQRTRPFTTADLNTILTTYLAIADVLRSPGTRFVDAVPDGNPERDPRNHINAPLIAAEARFQLQITFGPVFRNFDWPRVNTRNQLGRIGDNSRAAVLIHEATHIVDARSGEDAIHISEFDRPAYDQQPADLAIHNPSSYASFAAHIDLGRDPDPRFGLGATSRGL